MTKAKEHITTPVPIRLVFSSLDYDCGRSRAIFASVKGPDWKKDLWRAGANLPGVARGKFVPERNDEVRWFLVRSFWRHLGAG